jgi:hypothetical protein
LATLKSVAYARSQCLPCPQLPLLKSMTMAVAVGSSLAPDSLTLLIYYLSIILLPGRWRQVRHRAVGAALLQQLRHQRQRAARGAARVCGAAAAQRAGAAARRRRACAAIVSTLLRSGRCGGSITGASAAALAAAAVAQAQAQALHGRRCSGRRAGAGAWALSVAACTAGGHRDKLQLQRRWRRCGGRLSAAVAAAAVHHCARRLLAAWHGESAVSC